MKFFPKSITFDGGAGGAPPGIPGGVNFGISGNCGGCGIGIRCTSFFIWSRMIVSRFFGSVITDVSPESTRIRPSASRNIFDGNCFGSMFGCAIFSVVMHSAHAAGNLVGGICSTAHTAYHAR